MATVVAINYSVNGFYIFMSFSHSITLIWDKHGSSIYVHHQH